MKRIRHEIDATLSCSCTSCLYGTDSDRASLKRVKAGSRIDKLYFGKYLPLRERKLLDKLVRTRAVYDDVRNQLLSESSSIIHNKTNLKSKKNITLSKTEKEHDYTQKSSDISGLVDLVDKGVVLVDNGVTLGQKKISECCSCCSCSLHEHTPESHRRRRVGGHISSKSSVISRQKMPHNIRVGKHLRYAKHIRSDPCTCTLQFSDLSKYKSRTSLKRIPHKQEPVLESLPFEDSKLTSKTINRHPIKQLGMGEADRKSFTKCACIAKENIQSKSKKSLEKIIDATQKFKQRLETSTRIPVPHYQKQQVDLHNLLIKEPALGEISRRSLVKCACRVKENIELAVKKSVDKINDTKEKIKEKVEASIKKTTQKKDSKQKKELENDLTIRKDSLTVYRKQLERKRQLKDWECDFECFPEECIPEECYRIKKRGTARKSRATGYGIEKTQRKIMETETSSVSDVKVQANDVKKNITTATKIHKIKTDKNVNNLAEPNIRLEVGSNYKARLKETGPKKKVIKTGPSKKTKPKEITCLCEKNEPSNAVKKMRSIKSMTSLPSTASPKSNSESDLIKRSRQAVKISSSFSFNVEFYKDKPVTKTQTEQKAVSKDKITNIIKKKHHRHKSSGTSQKHVGKNNQGSDYTLKRCFCTLKLKAKRSKTKINKSFVKDRKDPDVIKGKSIKVSTESLKVPSSVIINRLPPISNFLPYECERMVCIPGKCNPEECEKKRGVKYNSIETNTNNRTKSTTSIATKTVSANNYKKTQASENTALSKPEKQQPPPFPPPVFSLNENDKPKKQVVRIGSSFSFNIEFAKERPTNNERKHDIHIVKTKEKKIDNVKFIRHRPSQVSISTAKSKYSSTKHTLRKCLCTLGLVKSEKKKDKIKTLSKGTLTISQRTSRIRHVAPPVTCNCNKAIETEEKEKIFRKYFKHNLLPYECEPEICVPGECNPYECKEIITKREAKLLKGHKKQSSTEYRRTKSVSSFTSKSMTPLKVKKVQSTSPTFKSIIPIQKNSVAKEERVILCNANRQVVRIGSNFSFNIEFFKDVLPLPVPVKNIQRKNKIKFKERGVQDKGNYHKSKNNVKCGCTQLQKKDRSVSIGPAIKRCFCTLKLQKSGKNKVSNVITTGTETIFFKEEMYPKFEMATKGTKTNKKLNNIGGLESSECEPYICVPGNCDPYQCLEIIKRRNVTRQSHEFSASTDRVKTKSTGSMTFKSDSKAKDVQSDIKHQKAHTKKRRRTKYSILNDDSENPSRQVVKVSSKFGFNVEFFKDQNSGEEPSNEIHDTKRKIVKNKGEKSLKTSISQRKSQSVQIKKKPKASGVEHVLKRCFCTLKLQNKVNSEIRQNQQNKSYSRPLKTTVMPIQVCTKIMNIHNIENTKISNHLPAVFKESNINNDNMLYYYCNRDDSIMHFRKETPIIVKQRQNSKNRDLMEYTKPLITKINKQHSQLIGLSPFLRNCFCTMNIHVEKSGKKSQNLKSYECEPGICVPNECDPYICQKNMMKRLLKRASTTTATKIRSKSISSGTTESKAKRNQYEKIPKDVKVQRTTLKNELSRPHKQAVRVGSNFSFNIEFAKDRSPSASTSGNNNAQSLKHVDKNKNRGTKGFNTNYYDKSSQSEINTQHRASSVTPKMKRCLCTLKLQKKGRQQNAMNLQVDKYKTSLAKKKNVLPKVRTTEAGQNTNTPKRQNNIFDLSPYVCEPLICVPGECDPYKCLELINKRNKKHHTREFGTDSIRSRKISASSFTTQQNRQTREKQIQSKEILNKPRYFSKPINEVVIKPSRQAVRIGSSCSFNVEFYKDRSYSENRFDVPNEKVKIKELSSQDYKSIYHRNSQAQSSAKRVKSTKTTTFIKRCFCTPKLHVADKFIQEDTKVTQNQNDSPSFLQKCFCKLKSITAVKQSAYKTASMGTETLIKTDKFRGQQLSQNTDNRGYRPQVLDPYECEPGICVPGECDPYICAKIIQNRKAKLLTKLSITDSPKTKSMSTSHKPSKVSKGLITNSKENKPHAKRNINQPSGRNSARKQRKLSSSSPKRNIVRIGSNFSFDIEFYKNKSHLKQFQNTSDAIKKTSKGWKPQNKAVASHDISLRNRKSQIKAARKENRASGVGPILKRCFCTLKLHNQPNTVPGDFKKANDKQKEIDACRFCTKCTETTDFKALPNVYTEKVMSYNLKHYECEPNICIPGKCDPYECEKLIKKRLRESATSTPMRNMKSTTSTTKSKRTSKGRPQELSLKPKNNIHTNNNNSKRLKDKTEKTKKISIDRRSRQAVIIGSNFSFDIEFFKNKGIGDRAQNKTPLIQKEGKKLFNKKSQPSKNIRHMDSQVLPQKVLSKVTQVTPFLKRCFCTLKLHKSDKKPIATQNVATITNEKLSDQIHRKVDNNPNWDQKYQALAPHWKLDPYECEPGICVSSMCDPYKCDERIKKRRKEIKSKLSGTDGSKDQSTSSLGQFKDEKPQGNLNPLERSNLKTNSLGVKKYKLKRDSHRQAVRIGSSFSLDIEFYKDQPPKDPYIAKRKNKQESKLKNVTSDRRVSFRHCQSQLRGDTPPSKGSGVGPLLKRCFCTLKLQKVGKLQQRSLVKLEPKTKVKDPSASAKNKHKQKNELMRNSGSETRMHGLQSYECEPNICIPGECDPFECEKRIKKKKIRELGIGTKSPAMKSVYSVTRASNKVQTKKNQASRNCICNKLQATHILSIDKAPKKVKRFSHNLHAAEMAKPANRQAVRIGSNFSFNVEFHKERSLKEIVNGKYKALKGKSETNVSNIKSRSRASHCEETCTYNRKQQVKNVKRESRGSGMAPMLKRCLCTLALQKKDNKDISNITSVKTKPSEVSTRNKSTLTKAEPFSRKWDLYECEPGICIPGECNPYECHEVIKKRDFKSKSKKNNTRRYQTNKATECRCKSVSTLKSKGMHFNYDDKQIHEPKIIEPARYPFVFDRIANSKQAVKIGSNFSFNIEFYKEKSPINKVDAVDYNDGKRNNYSKSERVKDLRPKPDHIKMTNTNICKLKNCEMQAQCLKTENKASGVGNALKRCFCTSRLHKTNLPNTQTQRQNVITVGRVDQIKIKSPFKPSKSLDQDQMKPLKSAFKNKIKKSPLCPLSCTTSTKDTKTVSTKINKKFLISDPLYVNQIINHGTQKNAGNKAKNDFSDMKTILPYIPRKFNKNRSKTALIQTKKETEISFDKKFCLCCRGYLNQDNNTNKVPQSKSKKKANSKISKGRGNTIEIKETNEMANLGPPKPKLFLWRCMQIFTKRSKKPQSVSDECPCEPPNRQTHLKKIPQKDILKISKSERRPKIAKTTVPKKSKSMKMTTMSENNKSQENSNLGKQKKNQTRFQGGDAGQHEMGSAMNNPTSDLEDKKCICLSCNARQCPRQNKLVKFSLSPTVNGNLENTYGSKERKTSRSAQQKRSKQKEKSHFFCSLGKCFSTTNKQYAGIPDIYNSNKNQSETFTRRTKKDSEYKKGALQKGRQRDTELPRQKKTIGINYKFVKKKYPCADIKTGSCPRCNKKLGGYNLKAQCLCGSPHHKCLCNKPVKKKCPCGSHVCREESKIQHVEYTKKPKKPCVCGSATCAREAEAEHICMCNCRCGKIMGIRKRKRDKKERKEYLKRVKIYNKEDRVRRKQRLKENKQMYKRARKYRKTTDVDLAAQSVSDIAKLGYSSLVDVGRSIHRAVTDPTHVVECMKKTAKDPKHGWKIVKTAVSDSNVGATYKRVRLRVGAMSCSKKAKSKLEACAITNYLMHMFDKDPKKRLKRKPQKRVREQTDFGCSLFIGSLRKRPFLSVYNTCPWFYPHCLSMLSIWRQFSDIMLFLLAVVVWSPCILCMEGCRALMCCFLCTG